MGEQKFCSNCGTQRSSNDKFCPNCGGNAPNEINDGLENQLVGTAVNKGIPSGRKLIALIIGLLLIGIIGGYGLGIKKKTSLLQKEGITIRKGKVVNYEKNIHSFL